MPTRPRSAVELAASERLGRNIRQARKRTGLSRERVAKLADLDLDSVYKIETGRRTPKILTLTKLAGSLGVSLDCLLEGIEWKPGDPT